MTERRSPLRVGAVEEKTLSASSGGGGGGLYFGLGDLDAAHIDAAHNWGLPATYAPPMPTRGPTDGNRYENLHTGDVWAYKRNVAANGDVTWGAEKVNGRPRAIEYETRAHANMDTFPGYKYMSMDLPHTEDWRDLRIQGVFHFVEQQLNHLVFRFYDKDNNLSFKAADCVHGITGGWLNTGYDVNYQTQVAIKDDIGMAITYGSLNDVHNDYGIAVGKHRRPKCDFHLVRFGDTHTGINLRAYYHSYNNVAVVVENGWLFTGQPDIARMEFGGNNHGSAADTRWIGRVDFVRKDKTA